MGRAQQASCLEDLAEGPQSSRSDGTARPRFLSQFDFLMVLIFATLVCSEGLLTWRVHLYGLDELIHTPAFYSFIAICGLHVYCRWRRFPQFVEVTKLVIWVWPLLSLLRLLMLIAGRTSTPLQDKTLASIDQRIHISTVTLVHFVDHFPVLQRVLDLSYDAIIPLVAAALILPPLLGKAQASWRFMLSIVIAALLTAGLFALCPAVGPWVTEGFSPSESQAAVETYLHLLKSAGAVRLNPDACAVVSFPSFHIVLAMLSTIALWSLRRARPLITMLALAISLSTLTTGWHYAVDVAGGLAVTLMAHVGAMWTSRRTGLIAS